jgi:hypothetical protein
MECRDFRLLTGSETMTSAMVSLLWTEVRARPGLLFALSGRVPLATIPGHDPPFPGRASGYSNGRADPHPRWAISDYANSRAGDLPVGRGRGRSAGRSLRPRI